MGALHRGHLELIRVAREHAGTDGEVAVSIFVNPLQFEPGSDFEKYPRPESTDEKFCEDAGANLLFRPRQMYFDDRSVYVEETRLSAGFAARRGQDISAASVRWWQSFLICSRRLQRCSGKRITSNWRSSGEWCAT